MTIRPLGARKQARIQELNKSQYLPLRRSNETGEWEPIDHCIVKLFCVTDGSIRHVPDDGESRGGQPGQLRQQLIRNLALRDDAGEPVFYVEERLQPWRAGNGKLHQPVPAPLVTAEAKERSGQYIEARDRFLSEAAGKAKVVQSKQPAASFEVVDTRGESKSKARAAP